MSGVPASSHGLSTGGGTLTGPLVIAPGDGNVIPLSVQAGWNAQNQDFFQVVNSDTGTRMFVVDVSGNVLAFRHTSEAERNFKSDGSAVQGEIPGVLAAGATGARTLGLYDHIAAAQPAAIANAAAGVVIDAEARTALNALLAAMRTVGLIAT